MIWPPVSTHDSDESKALRGFVFGGRKVIALVKSSARIDEEAWLDRYSWERSSRDVGVTNKGGGVLPVRHVLDYEVQASLDGTAAR